MKGLKGGSIASDAVTSLVDAKTYDIMSKSFTNDVPARQEGGKRSSAKKRGGCSSCSKAVPHRVCNKRGGASMLGSTHEAFANFANSAAPYDSLLPGDLAAIASGLGVAKASEPFKNSANSNTAKNVAAKAPNSGKNAAKNSSANASKNATANATKNASANATKNVAVSKNASTTNASKNASTANATKNASSNATAAKNASTNTAKIGGFARNLTQLMNANSQPGYSVFNKKKLVGGADAAAAPSMVVAIEPQMDRSAFNGVPAKAPVAITAEDFLAQEAVIGMGTINKQIQYGSPLDTRGPFSFGQSGTSGGAWGKKSKGKGKPASAKKSGKSASAAAPRKSKK